MHQIDDNQPVHQSKTKLDKIRGSGGPYSHHRSVTSSNGNIFRVPGHLCGEFTGQWLIPHKSQWRGALMFSLICAWMSGWVNNRKQCTVVALPDITPTVHSTPSFPFWSMTGLCMTRCWAVQLSDNLYWIHYTYFRNIFLILTLHS